MMAYTQLTAFFGTALSDVSFQQFLAAHFPDLTDYNILEGGYCISEQQGIELGFVNTEAVYDDDEEIVMEVGNPIFAYVNAYPVSAALLKEMPFGIQFDDSRSDVVAKAGTPAESKEGYEELLDLHFLVDNYMLDGLTITIDYAPETHQINFIQIRDNQLVEI